MTFFKIITEPAILIITAVFLFFIMTVLKNYNHVKKNLGSVLVFLSEFKKNEMSYRFGALDEFMSQNSFTSIAWEDFKKALIFPEKFYIASQNIKNSGEYAPEIYLTVDSSYFFNEETLVFSKINHKFIQTMPTLLTGLGPFFTFLKMAIAFTSVNFSAEADAINSLNSFIASIQIAALCSVFAVGFSLLFIFIEKILYNRLCKKYYLGIQKEFIRLFDVITSEKFLIDLVKEFKIQSNANERLLNTLPENFATAFSKIIGETTVPFLENILYSLNKMNESLSKNNGGNDDVVDKLF